MTPDPNLTERSPDLLPARMLNEFTYCPRLFHLEYVQGEFEDSADTVSGRFRHRRVEDERGEVPKPGEGEEKVMFHARSVLLSGEKCGLIAKMDLIEGEGDKVTPVDYKNGSKPDFVEEAWFPDRVQLCAQGLILRENGYVCEGGVVYYTQSKTRVEVEFSDELVKTTLNLAEAAREAAETSAIPPPLVDSPKCPRCSLVGICLPDEVRALTSAEGGKPVEDEEVRRLCPARDDALPLYVQEQGLTVAKKGEELEIRAGSSAVSRARLMETSTVVLFGNIQMTAQALHELCTRDIPVCYFSQGGWFYGVTQGMSHKNVELRMKQYATAGDPAKALPIARSFVSGKIRNCRTLLRRNHRESPDGALAELSRLSDMALACGDLDALFGIEGAAGRVYFSQFGGMLKRDPVSMTFDFHTRNRRPPKDPVNALLSFAYALLAKTVTVTLLTVGFDPFLGFFHRPRYGRPSLALDMMEEFRPLIADSVVIGLINNQELSKSDFVCRAGAASITPDARKKLLRAYERRLDTLVTHPVFGYTISYRRILEVQARLLGRYLTEEIKEYPVFVTR